jgi:hypothetical protein
VGVTVLYAFYFACSMFSVIDELCIHAYINVCRFHWILLSIQVDVVKVDATDPLDKDPALYDSIVVMLQW